MKIRKSNVSQSNSNQNVQFRQKIDNFLKQTKNAKVIYPRKRKIQQEQPQMIRQEIQYTDQLIEKYQPIQQSFVASRKKSFQKYNYQKEQTLSRSSKFSNYQPKILQSFAIQKKNPQNKSLYAKSNRGSRVFSQKNILQQSNYAIQSDTRSQKQFSKSKIPTRMLTEVINQIGIKNNHFVDQFEQYTDLKGIQQFIRKKRESSSSSMFGRAHTEANQKLLKKKRKTEQQTFKSHGKQKRKFLSKSQVRSKPNLDMFIPYNSKFLPEIQGNKSMKDFTRKMRTQSSSPIGNSVLKEQIRRKMLNKVDQKINKTKSPSEKRLRQDYKYLIQNDDSQRYNKRIKPLLNEDKKKIKLLKVKQDMLGKIVLQRVQKHLKQQAKLKPNYITRVKSQKNIDEALIEFLKMKVNRADKVLS